ncbi:UNVERIFIED_CONTAM: hypothetical protein RMT77_018332 [Armadillidium vulgare]
MQVLFIVTLISFLLFGVHAFIFRNEYCKISASHVLCDKGFHKRCGNRDQHIYQQITEAEKEEVVALHNKYRSDCAMGKVVSNSKVGNISFPRAANMEELVWDSELERIAHGVVKKCYHTHLCKFWPGLTCLRSLRGFTQENIFKAWGTYSLEDAYAAASYEAGLKAIFDEKDKFHPDDIKKNIYKVNRLGFHPHDYGHFGLLMASRTRRVGCGKAAFPCKSDPCKSGQNMGLFSCLYYPGGTFLGGPIYVSGTPCSKCKGQNRNCSTKYPGLCSADSRTDEPVPDGEPSTVWLSKTVIVVCLSLLLQIYF